MFATFWGRLSSFLGILQEAIGLVQQKFGHRVAKQTSFFSIQPGTIDLAKQLTGGSDTHGASPQRATLAHS